jgi:dihydroorotate dehydrogenase
MSGYERLLRPLLFRLNPELVHHWGLHLIASGLIRTKMLSDSRLKVQALGIDFPNFLGLAAGFDKNAVAVNHWHGHLVAPTWE